MPGKGKSINLPNKPSGDTRSLQFSQKPIVVINVKTGVKGTVKHNKIHLPDGQIEAMSAEWLIQFS